ncbi:hypothetical protein [Alistipes sp.]
MEEVPVGFILILLGVLAGALLVTVAVYTLRERRVQRLKDPHRDYLKERR